MSQVIVSGTIHDQKLLSGENGFSNDRPCATRTSEPNDSDNQVKKKDTHVKRCLSRMRRAAKRGKMLKTKKAGDGDRTRDVHVGKMGDD